MQCQGVATSHLGTGSVFLGGKSSQHYKRIHSSFCKVRDCLTQILLHFKQLQLLPFFFILTNCISHDVWGHPILQILVDRGKEQGRGGLGIRQELFLKNHLAVS